MEIIRLTHPPDIPLDNAGEKVMALGYFDGVHVGHQEVINTAVNLAKQKGMKSAVMTFHPHPSVVLKQLAKRDDYLTPPEQKAADIKKLGVDFLYFVRFDKEFSSLLPQAFIDEYIIRLNVKHAVAGFDFTYGKMAKGNMETITQHSRNMFETTTIQKVTLDGEKVSTTKIRELVQEGAIEKANNLLGRPYRMDGMVIHGDKRGRKMGFPTANIKVHSPYVLPSDGIYAVKMQTESGWHQGVGYIGKRPTFYNEHQPAVVEVHLFDFDSNIYGETVSVEWYSKVRDDISFDSAEELIGQMEKDKQEAEAFFADGSK